MLSLLPTTTRGVIQWNYKSVVPFQEVNRLEGGLPVFFRQGAKKIKRVNVEQGIRRVHPAEAK